MSNTKISNKCENCGSELLYNPTNRCLCCKHCDSTFPISQTPPSKKRLYDPRYKDELFESSQLVCTNCGNHYTYISEPIRRCVSCGSNSLKEIVSTTIRPDGIIPFTITKDQAGQMFFHWMKTKMFAPNDLKKMAKFKKITANYIPVWNFDYESNMVAAGVGNRRVTDSDGDSHTYHIPFSYTAKAGRANFFIKGNKTLSSEIIRSLEYNMDNLTSFNPAYFFGWAALKNDIERSVANNMMRIDSQKLDDKLLKDKICSDFTFDGFDKYQSTSDYNYVAYNFIYLPMWINYYEYKDKIYKFYVNGSTGTIVGRYPKSILKILFFILGIISPPIILALILFLL